MKSGGQQLNQYQQNKQLWIPSYHWVQIDKDWLWDPFTFRTYQVSCRGCAGSHKKGARKIAKCHFHVPVLKVRSQLRSQVKCLLGGNFFEPKLWIINRLHVLGMFSFMYRYKWSRFVCTNVNVYIVLLFFISISSSETKKIYIIYYNK